MIKPWLFEFFVAPGPPGVDVTPQAALAAAKPPFAITHKPGCMFVCDLKESDPLG